MGDLLQPFDLEVRVQREFHALQDLPPPIAELRGSLVAFEETWSAVNADPGLNELGRLNRKSEIRAQSAPALDEWAARHVGPLENAIAARESALAAKLAAAPKPSPEQLQALLPRLPQDETQLLSLYASGTPSERAALEALSESVGRLPVQRADGSWAWGALVDADAVARHREALLRDADPALVSELDALRRQRGMLRGLLATARALVRDAR